MIRLRDRRARALEVIQYKKDHPELTMDEIGIKFGLTVSRISKILKNGK
jgi:DNA-directed RNA polymerase sigma subunit (sigma70/sigma32)